MRKIQIILVAHHSTNWCFNDVWLAVGTKSWNLNFSAWHATATDVFLFSKFRLFALFLYFIDWGDTETHVHLFNRHTHTEWPVTSMLCENVGFACDREKFPYIFFVQTHTIVTISELISNNFREIFSKSFFFVI